MAGPESRYADALFSAAGKDKIDAVAEDLTSLVQFFTVNGECWRFFCSPVISAGKKKAVLTEILAPDTNETARNFLFLLVDKKRMELLPQILLKFSRLVSEQEHRLIIKIFSARPLPDTVVSEITQAYRQKAGAEDALAELIIDPSLLGGICVQVGDMRYDNSLKARLVRLGAALS